MCLINSIQLLMMTVLLHTTGAFRSCKNFNFHLSGIDDTRIDKLNQSSCGILKDLAKQCGSVKLEIELDEYVSKYYEEIYDIYIEIIQSNITLYNTDIADNSTGESDEYITEKSDTKVPLVVIASFATVASGGLITYFIAEKIKTMCQSGTYYFSS